MSLLSVCQNVLNITGWDELSTISGNTDKTAKQILAIANQELRSLGKRFDWRHCIVEYEFDTVVDQVEYALPEDYEKLVKDSVYNKDEYYRLRSGVSEAQWNQWKHGLLGSISHQRYRITLDGVAPVFLLSPAPSSAESLVLFYKSSHFAYDNSNTAKAQYENDDDRARIPEDVVEMGVLWRFKRAKGLDFSAELAEYNEMTKTRFAQTLGESELPIPNNNFTPELTDGYVPDSGFGS